MRKKKTEEKAVIRATMLRTVDGDYVPVKIIVTRYEKEVLPKRLETLVNPNRNLLFKGASPYLTSKLLGMAPDIDLVREQIEELIRGVPVYGKEEKAVRQFLKLAE